MANIQLKCGIISKKIAMQAGDDKRMINYEWLNNHWPCGSTVIMYLISRDLMWPRVLTVV